MKIHIMNWEQAVDFVPHDPTYAIRLISTDEIGKLVEERSLQDSPLYTIKKYYFDDVKWYAYKPKEQAMIKERVALGRIKLIDDGIASRIISDFMKFGRDKKSLLVHCTYGMNRSPAVAIGLNDIFSLGNDSEELKKNNPDYHVDIYKRLIKIARRYYLLK